VVTAELVTTTPQPQQTISATAHLRPTPQLSALEGVPCECLALFLMSYFVIYS
jgi:hypothetical protein